MGIFATNHIIIFHFSFLISHFFCTFAAAKRVSPVRPAPFESPRVGTAMQIAYPPASLAQLARARDL